MPKPKKCPSGVCRICKCTGERGCPGGCGWADKAHTLCSICQSMIVEMMGYLDLCYSVSLASVKRLLAEAKNA